MKPQVTKESLAQWITELESQPHLSLREERYLAVMKKLASLTPCNHNWSKLVFVSESGCYEECGKCGEIRTPK